MRASTLVVYLLHGSRGIFLYGFLLPLHGYHFVYSATTPNASLAPYATVVAVSQSRGTGCFSKNARPLPFSSSDISIASLGRSLLDRCHTRILNNSSPRVAYCQKKEKEKRRSVGLPLIASDGHGIAVPDVHVNFDMSARLHHGLDRSHLAALPFKAVKLLRPNLIFKPHQKPGPA